MLWLGNLGIHYLLANRGLYELGNHRLYLRLGSSHLNWDLDSLQGGLSVGSTHWYLDTHHLLDWSSNLHCHGSH